MKRIVLLLIATLSAFSQDLSGYQKVLLPVFSKEPLQGANGAVFFTRLQAAAAANTTLSWGGTTQTIIGGPYASTVAYPGPESASRGRILFLPPGANVSFDYTLSTYLQNQPGVQAARLPVVRETQLRTGPSTIFDMLTSPNYSVSSGSGPTLVFNGTFAQRHMLRIYDADNTGRLSVDVTFTAYSPFNGQENMRIDVNRREGNDPSYPTFGERMIDGICIRSGMFNQCSGANLFITITPNDPAIRYYAMLSTTDNTTQAVAIHVPQ